MSTIRYVPVVRARNAECEGIKWLSHRTKAVMMPLFEVVPPSERMPIPERIKDNVGKIYSAWEGRRCFADLRAVSEFSSFYQNRHVIDDFFDWASRFGMDAVPVTAFDRDPEYQKAVARVSGRGIAIRLGGNDFDDPSLLRTALGRLRSVAGVEMEQVDIIIDYGDVQNLALNSHAIVSREHVNSLPDRDAWRSLTVVATSMPYSLEGLTRGQWTKLPRKEWVSWRGNLAGSPGFARPTHYGDYSAHGSGEPEGGIPKSASLRYAADNEYMIWRGETRDDNYQADMHSICADLIRMEEYPGPDYCWGDREIHETATTPGSPGEPVLWRAWATSHYCELVARQFASLPSP